MASGDPATRSAVLKILVGLPDRREIVKRYIVFSKSLAGWARDRAGLELRMDNDARGALIGEWRHGAGRGEAVAAAGAAAPAV
jgi:predicted NBD/HSP70 family sugar kinase